MKNITLLLFTFIFLLSGSTIAQTTVILQPNASQGKDAVVWSNAVQNNYGNHESFTAYTWTNQGLVGIKRAFIAFDLSSIPSTAEITDARLSLYYNPTDPNEGFDYHTGNNDIYIERVIAAWNENTVNWSNQPTTTSTNRVSLPPSTSPTQNYLNIDVTNLVSDMHNPSIGNYGFMMRMADEINYYKSVLLASSDNPDSSLHPKLEVTYRNCTVIKPGATSGKDASVWSNGLQNNYGNAESLTAYTWTNQGNLGIKRAFLSFDFSTIPSNATITSAKMSLFYNPTDANEGFDFHTGSNDIYIERVNAAWNENTITWNNQPATTSTNRISLPASTSQTQNYLDIDVTALVNDIRSSANGNNGFMIRMQDEVNYYKSVLFASSDHPSNSLHPQIEICWDASVSVNEVNASDFDFNLYPNPNQGAFQISLPGNKGNIYTIEVYDIVGKKVLEYKENRSLHSVELDKKGAFFIRISDRDGNYAVKKFIIQ